MKASRKLVLKAETLTELGNDQLRAVAGGAWTPWCYSFIEPTGCLSLVETCGDCVH